MQQRKTANDYPTQQAPEREVEILQCQPVKVKLGYEFTNLFGPPGKEG